MRLCSQGGTIITVLRDVSSFVTPCSLLCMTARHNLSEISGIRLRPKHVPLTVANIVKLDGGFIN